MNKALKDMTRDELRDLAKGLQLKGYSKLTRDELQLFIQETYKRARTLKAEQPMSTEDRLNAYTRGGRVGLTARQAAHADRMARRMEYRKGIR